ncbi:MAG: M56 family metallopeptidase [Oscillospiraceae bacterium]|jgi:beta-lactamase regulating signal transducer with metallopeptidase domain|nr:M56 family metallopeptidase [Oscillospiraceae bacterium]
MMTEIIRAMLVMSLSGSMMALLLFVLKPLIKNRLLKSSQYCLWLIVLAALLVPVSVFITIPYNSQALPTISNAVDWYVDEVSEVRGRWQPYERFDGNGHVIIWWLGMVAVGIFQLAAYAVFVDKLKRNSIRIDIDCKIPVYISNKAATPMLVGLFNPKIVLPERAYSEAQLQAILRHELTHLRRMDVLIKWLTVLACAVHWFNPMVWFIRREMDCACELACDEAVIAKLNASGRQNYGNTLIYVAATHKPRTALAMSEGGRRLKERLGAIMKNKKRTRITLLISVVFILAVTGATIALGAGTRVPAGKGYEFFPHRNPLTIQNIPANPEADSISVSVGFISTKGPSELRIALINSNGDSDEKTLKLGEHATLTLHAEYGAELIAEKVGGNDGKAFLEVEVRYGNLDVTGGK